MPKNNGYEYKPIQSTPIIDLASKMDNRSSNEYLNVDPNSTSFTFTNLQNADLFNTKSLSTRLGVVDISGGPVNTGPKSAIVFNYSSGTIPSGITDQFQWNTTKALQAGIDTTEYSGMLIIPSGDMNILQGSIQANGQVISIQKFTNQEYYDLNFNFNLYTLNQTSAPASGLGFMSGNTSGQFSNIALSGTYANSPYPIVPSGAINALSNLVARTTTSGVNFGTNYTFNPSLATFISNWQTIPFDFTAPVQLFSGNVYFLKIQPTLTSGTLTRNFGVEYITSTSETGINTVYALGDPITQNPDLAVYPLGSIKSQLYSETDKYVTPSFIIAEKPTANFDFASPIVSGTTLSGTISQAKTINTITPFNGAISVPPFDTTSVEFGEIIRIPSGLHTIDGAYFYATLNSRPEFQSYTVNKQLISGNNYNLGYQAYLSNINKSSGTAASGNYQIIQRSVIAEYTGNQIFNILTNNLSGTNASIATPAYSLTKLQAIFNNPISLNLTSGTDYLLSFKYYDFNTGNPYTDYSYNNSGTSTQFQSFVMHGLQGLSATKKVYPSGVYLTNYNNDGQTFITPSGDLSYILPKNNDLSCGIISVASGSAITGLYDYRIGSSRAQKIIYAQSSNLNAFTLNNFASGQTIYSGAAVGNDFKWSFTTYQNLMFAHQYAKTSGVCWDQIYTNPSGGQSVQAHGQMPQFSLIEVSGTASGSAYGMDNLSGTTVSVMLATQMLSGGYRTNVQDITLSGNTNSFIRINGPSGLSNINYGNNIFSVSGNGFPITSQYAFDITPQSTYVFVTPSSGTTATFYLAGLVSGTSPVVVSGNPSFIPNPLPNVNSFNGPSGGTYIGDISLNTLTQQIPNVLNLDQSYFDEQVPTPKLKKMVIFHDYLVGAGDEDFPSRLWYTPQLQPQIFGTDGLAAGFIEVDPDNGSPITGLELYQDFMIVFKYNATYKIAYTQNSSIPFYIYNLDQTLGSLGFFGTMTTSYGVFALSQFGPILAKNEGVESIGDEIVPLFQTFDHTDLTFAVAIHDRERQQIYWSISSKNDSPENNTGLCYSYAEKAWNIRQGGMWNAAGIIGDFDNFNELYIGDTIGQIQQISVSNTFQDVLFDDGLGNLLTDNISLEGETPWLNFGNSMDLKQIKNLRINCFGSQQRLRVDVYYDQDPTKIQYTRFINMNVPVMNRVCSFGGRPCRTVKFIITSVGNPDQVQINSIQFSYQNLGKRINI